MNFFLLAHENDVVKCIKRTLKYEYGLKQMIKNKSLAQKITQQTGYIYNNLRTQFSLDLKDPVEVNLKLNIKNKFYRKTNVDLPELTI